MSKWIDANALIEIIKASPSYRDYEWSMYAEEFIEEMVVAPGIEIVRCFECKHGSDNKVYGCSLIDFNTDDYHRMYADDFCSYGERRE